MPKKPRNRRRIAKWAGLVVCVLIVVTWVVSQRWVCWYDGDGWALACGSGAIGVGTGVAYNPAGWQVLDSGWDDFRWRYQLPRFTRISGGTVAGTEYSIPLWMPLLAVAIPTAILWRRDRRKPPGHCRKCGYNLTGNVSGRCPECGARTSGEMEDAFR